MGLTYEALTWDAAARDDHGNDGEFMGALWAAVNATGHRNGVRVRLAPNDAGGVAIDLGQEFFDSP